MALWEQPPAGLSPRNPVAILHLHNLGCDRSLFARICLQDASNWIK